LRRRTLDHDICVTGEPMQGDHRRAARQGFEKRAGAGLINSGMYAFTGAAIRSMPTTRP